MDRRTAVIGGLAAFLPKLQTAPARAELGVAPNTFIGSLKLEDVSDQFENSGPYDPGDTEFKLLEDFGYVDANGRTWIVPAGTVVNGASIPQPAWSFVGGPWSGRYKRPSVVHDWMCVKRPLPSKDVHFIFYESMLAAGVSRAKAWIMFQAVELGGPQWSGNNFSGDVERPGLTDAQFEKIKRRAKRRFGSIEDE